MQTIRQIDALRRSVERLHDGGKRVALVPTMGALHAGHMALIKCAREAADHVVVSIFVNPKQFGAGEDLSRYPRQVEADSAMLEAAGVAVLWLPSVEEMYPSGFATNVSVVGLGDGLCGATRPGHFDGVATVVAKLFTQVRPDVAIFGEKDWQQLVVIRRITTDLNLGVEIIGAPTARDADGLALSSRNAYLSAEERIAAQFLAASLKSAGLAIEAGAAVKGALETVAKALKAAGFGPIDYVALVDPVTLTPLDSLKTEARILAAARLGTTRLIDNFAVSPKN